MDPTRLSENTSAPVARRLVSDDLADIVTLNRAHDDVMRHGKPSQYDEAFERSMRTSYLSGSSRNHAVFGAFIGNRLDAYLSIFLWNEFPYFSIGNLKTRPGSVNLFAAQANAFGACAEAALRFTEASGVFRGYMIRAAQRWPAARVRRSLVRSIPAVDRYHYEVEFVVPKGTRPPYPFAWNIMGQRTWEQDLAVEALTLKQECRESLPIALRRAA